MTDDSANKMIGERSNVLIDRIPHRAIYPQMPEDTRMGKLSLVIIGRSDTESPRTHEIIRRSDFQRIGAITEIVI